MLNKLQPTNFITAGEVVAQNLGLPKPTLHRLGSSVIMRSGDKALRITDYKVKHERILQENEISIKLNLYSTPYLVDESTHKVGSYIVAVNSWQETTRNAAWVDAGNGARDLHLKNNSQNWGLLPLFDPLVIPKAQLELLRKNNGLTISEAITIEDSLTKAQNIWDKYKHIDVSLVHGDLTPQNILVTKNSMLIHDLENIRQGPRAWDIVRPLYTTLRYNTSLDILNKYMIGYNLCKDSYEIKIAEKMLPILDLCSTLWATVARLYEAVMNKNVVETKIKFLQTNKQEHLWQSSKGILYRGLQMWE